MSEVNRYSAKYLKALNTGHAVTGLSHEVVMYSDYARLEQECERLKSALKEIDAFGHGSGHGRGFTCADIASEALSAKP